jgi:tetratricopeptide (TPR) repeat protein
MSRSRLVALLLALITLAVYLPAGQFAFVNFDDNEYITNNPMVRAGLTWAGFKWAFTTWAVSNWHPVTWLSHMLDCELFGLHAGAHHLVNVLLHAVNAALLFTVLLRLTQRLWPSALVAVLFAWHPLHVESVAWVSERKDVLSAFFALLALLNYVRHVKENRRGNLWLALGFFALGLLAKPMLVTLPFVLLLLDYWPLGRIRPEDLTTRKMLPLLVEKIPFFILTAISCMITLAAQQSGHSVISLEALPVSSRLAVATTALAGYAGKLLWPANLCALYLLPKHVQLLPLLGALMVLLGLSWPAWRWRQTRPYLFVGWLWFIGTLIPVIGLVQVGDQAMADRYTYLPSIGFFLAVVFLADEFAARWRIPSAVRFGTAGLACVACIILTEKQLPTWRNGEALFRQAVAVNPANDTALIDLGVTLSAQGRFAEAVETYQRAIAVGTRKYQAHNNLGNALDRLGRHEESLAAYRDAVRMAPDNSKVRLGLGRQLAALGRYEEAIREFSEAARLSPGDAAPPLEAAKAYFKLGQDERGLVAFQEAVRLDSKNFQTLATVAHYLAANENAAARDGKNALLLASAANDLSAGRQPVVLDVLGMALAENGDFTNAIAAVQLAIQSSNTVGFDVQPMQARLNLYQNRQPWRESFRATNSTPLIP